jgi:hypothetical protein
MDEFFHRKSLDDYLSWKPELLSVAMKKATGAREDLRGFAAQKKTARTFSVRAGRPVTQLTSSLGAVRTTDSFTGIYTP